MVKKLKHRIEQNRTSCLACLYLEYLCSGSLKIMNLIDVIMLIFDRIYRYNDIIFAVVHEKKNLIDSIMFIFDRIYR